MSLGPLYEALRARGYAADRECVLIEGVPVPFLPAYNALRVRVLREQARLDIDYLQNVLARHKLEATWANWTR